MAHIHRNKLHDQFAMAALSYLGPLFASMKIRNDEVNYELIAFEAYKLADAMMEEGERK